MNYTYISGIYKIENIINHKIYIGSAVSLTSRKAVHFKTLRDKTHHNQILQRSVNKYGIENFKFTILEIVSDKKELLKREQYWLDLLKPEYNILKTAGNSLGRVANIKTLVKISDHYRKKRDEISSEVISMYQQNIPIYKIQEILHSSSYRIRKILKENNINIRTAKEYHKIKVYQYTLDNIFIKEWNSCKEAADYLNLDLSSICKCANNKKQHYKNFKWKYKNIN